MFTPSIRVLLLENWKALRAERKNRVLIAGDQVIMRESIAGVD